MSRMHQSLVAAVLASLPLLAAEVPEPGLTFHASFDKRDVTADYAAGKAESTTFKESLELRGVEGISGPGFQLSQGERLDYDMKGNFDVRQGSVSLWVKSVNWEGKELTFQHFFCAQVKGAFNFYIYKYCQPTLLTFYISMGRRKVFARTPANRWRPGEWYKIDCTWDRRSMKLYVNSKMESETIIPSDFELPARDDGHFTITPVEYWKSRCKPDDRTAVDEVKVYNRVLSVAEIRRAYLKLAGKGEAPAPVDVVHEIDTKVNVVRVRVDAFEMAQKTEADLTARAQLRAADDQRTIAQAGTALKDAMATVELPYKSLAPDKYAITVEVASADGKHKEEVKREFERPAAPWLAPMPQYDHLVPKPWTPVEGDATRVRMWGREYRFDRAPMPRMITSQDMPVLAAPVSLKIDTGAGLVAPDWEATRVSERRPDAIARTGNGATGGLKVSFRSTVELDGMMRVDLTLAPAQGKAKVTALQLEVPVRAPHGDYVLTPVLNDWKSGKIALDFRHVVWLTGHHTGLCWFAESHANWVAGKSVNPIEIVKSDGASVLTIRFIDSPVSIDKPISYTFGLQATPVRPLPENWRSFNLGGHGKIPGSTASITAWGGGCLKMSAYLEPWRPDIMRRVCKKYRDRGEVNVPYSTPCYMSDHNPIFDFYRLEWRNSEGHKYVGYKHRDGFTYSMVATCPASDYSRLMAYWVENLSRDYDIGGVYFDCCSPDRCSNSRHGCGGVDAFGRRYATYPIFGLRRVLKRVFTILHSRGKILINHAHSRFVPPCHAFSDYWWPGEQYTSKLGRNIYYYADDMDRREWQVELSARNRGVGISFLPEYGRGTDKKYRDEETEPSRSLLACCVVHDVPCSASWIHLGELEKVWKLYSEFGLSKAKFRPYWEDCPVQVDRPLVASAYELPNALVIMVANLTPNAAKGALRVDASKLRVKGKPTIRNELTGQALGAGFDAIPVDLPDRDYTVVSVTWRADDGDDHSITAAALNPATECRRLTSHMKCRSHHVEATSTANTCRPQHHRPSLRYENAAYGANARSDARG